MRARVYILSVLAMLFLAGCNKPQEADGTDMHEFTPEELEKKKLDDAFTVFFGKLGLENIDNPTSEILKNSSITVPRLGTIRYTYTKDGLTLISMDVKAGMFEAKLHGGISVVGKSLRENGILVFIDGSQVATLDLVMYNKVPTPVFRFPDGTTYAVTGVLLVEPLLDFLLENVFSTE